MKRLTVLACIVFASMTASADAVVGGHSITYESVPAYAQYSCGGTLIAADRVARRTSFTTSRSCSSLRPSRT
jgi:hypothetical protein